VEVFFCIKKTAFRRFFVACRLTSDKREETHKSSAFDGIGEATLTLCRDIGTLFGQNTSVGIQELLQKLYILVVDMLDIILGKVTLFCHR
jgi:hypothetical protein